MMNDSKWRFCLRLQRFFRTCYIADARQNPQYEMGWNDAVTALSGSVRLIYESQEPFLKTLIDDIGRPIPRATVAEALQELECYLVQDAEAAASWGNGTTADTIRRHVGDTIAKLGLAEETK